MGGSKGLDARVEYVLLQVAALKNTGPSGVSDAAFSSLFDENTRLREQCASQCVNLSWHSYDTMVNKQLVLFFRLSGSSGSDFDIGAFRAAALAATPPNIIECVEASDGGSQEVCHLPNV